MNPSNYPSAFIAQAKRIIDLEIDGLTAVKQQLDEQFADAITAILNTQGRLVVIGMGKSGLIGRKIMATLASTGTPSLFVHPGEAYHGDLGSIHPDDMVLLLSNSGETSEILQLLPFLQDNGNQLIAITGNTESTLAQHVHFHLNGRVEKEACPHDLAPTTSTTAALALGDALAMVLMQARGFEPQDFARFHPGGNLGKRLLTQVRHVMQPTPLPQVEANSSIADTVQIMTQGRLGMCLVTDDKQRIGIITDGDLRRGIEQYGAKLFDHCADSITTWQPKSIAAHTKLTDAESFMAEHKITHLLVSETDSSSDDIIGMVQFHHISG